MQSCSTKPQGPVHTAHLSRPRPQQTASSCTSHVPWLTRSFNLTMRMAFSQPAAIIAYLQEEQTHCKADRRRSASSAFARWLLHLLACGDCCSCSRDVASSSCRFRHHVLFLSFPQTATEPSWRDESSRPGSSAQAAAAYRTVCDDHGQPTTAMVARDNSFCGDLFASWR